MDPILLSPTRSLLAPSPECLWSTVTCFCSDLPVSLIRSCFYQTLFRHWDGEISHPDRESLLLLTSHKPKQDPAHLFPYSKLIRKNFSGWPAPTPLSCTSWWLEEFTADLAEPVCLLQFMSRTLPSALLWLVLEPPILTEVEIFENRRQKSFRNSTQELFFIQFVKLEKEKKWCHLSSDQSWKQGNL